MSNDKYNIEDIVNFAADSNPLNVKQAVDNLLLSKIQNEVENRKMELARTMFNDGKPFVPDDESEIIYDDENADDTEFFDDDEDFDISDEDLEDLLSDLDTDDYETEE